MSATPSRRPENSTCLPSGSTAGAWAWSCSTGKCFCTEPSSTLTRKRVRRLSLRPKKATCSPLGEKDRLRPATKSSLNDIDSKALPVSPPVRFLSTLPSRAESSTMSPWPSLRLAVRAAMTSPEGLGAKPKTWT